jgi:FliA/WhiG family RNA polymerase sigma factor
MTANSSQLRKYKEASKSPRGTPGDSAAKAGARKGKATLKSVDAQGQSEARVEANVAASITTSVEAVEEVDTPAPVGKNGRPTVRFGSAQSEARFNSEPGPNGFVRSEADRTELIKEYAPLIKFVAQKIAVRLPANIELDDLISSGVIGLMDAIDKYDPNRDNRFKTYAEFRIRGAILDELRSQDWVPRSVRDKAKLLDKTVSELEIELGRQATDEEVAERLNMTIEEFFELVNQVLPELKAKEIKVHSLAFSEQADKMLLSEISAATDGMNWFTATSDEVHKSFANLFLVVKRPQVLQMRSRSFALDEDVDEATFYITRDEGSKLTLISPKNEEMMAGRTPEWVTWFAGKNFDVITMKEPDIGEWQVQSAGAAEGFATVLTNLRLVTDWPVVVRVGDKSIVQARLYDGEKPVALPEMSGVIQYAFQVVPTDRIAAAVTKDFLNDEGRDGDKVARDGIFSRYCTIAEPGEYKLSIVARGPTFERTQQVPFRVRPPLLSFSIVPDGEHGHGDSHEAGSHKEHAHGGGEPSGHEAGHGEPGAIKGDPSFIFRAELSKEALGFRDVEVTVQAVSRNRKKTVVHLKRQHGEEGSHYEATVDALPEVGLYTVTATLRGISKKGQEMEAGSEPLKFELTGVEKKVEPTVAAVPTEVHYEEPKDAGSLPYLPLALIVGSGILAMIVGVVLTKKKKGLISTAAPYNPPKQMLDAIESLEQKVATSDIKIGNVKLESEVEAERAEAARKEANATQPEGESPPRESEAGPVEDPPTEEA